MALLIGFALDQQVTVQKAFAGPLALRERVGTLDAAALSGADLESAFREKPAIHRFPGAMAKRVHDLAVHVEERYGGDAAKVWTGASSAEELRANLAALPGFGQMKVNSLSAVLAKRFGVAPPSRSRRRTRPWETSIRRRRSRTTRPPSASTRRSGRPRNVAADRASLTGDGSAHLLRAGHLQLG